MVSRPHIFDRSLVAIKVQVGLIVEESGFTRREIDHPAVRQGRGY